MCIVGSEQPIT